jgi:large subunit ribosomal protein L23
MADKQISDQWLDRAYRILGAPLSTEKSTSDAEGKVPVRAVNRGAEQRRAYHFRVPQWANKIDVRRAVETVFSVRVEKVNTITKHGKPFSRGFNSGHTAEWKKAIVTLEPGQQIELV